jgi:toxin-antitoxin system PIN domain toxin
MTFLLDTNILIALAWRSHQHHRRAADWLVNVQSFATCPITQGGLIRISTHREFPLAVTMDYAFAALDSILGDPRHTFWPDEISFGDPTLRQQVRTQGDVTDFYLAALARHRGGNLATFDQRLFKKLENLSAVTLL